MSHSRIHGRSGSHRDRGVWRRLLATLVATPLLIAALAACGSSSASSSRPDPYTTTLDYVIRFYPRWFTNLQATSAGVNVLRGTDIMGPKFGVVVAPNDDTIYCQAWVDLADGPQILTIPSTSTVYSLLVLDVWGNVIQTSIRSRTPGTYALVEQGWTGTLPQGTTRVDVPYRLTLWVVRADRHVGGEDRTAEATAFRASLRMSSLAQYEKDPTSGATQVVPTAVYAAQTKAIADEAILQQPTGFIRQLQEGVHAATTAPMTASDRRLSSDFDTVLTAAGEDLAHGNYQTMSRMVQGAQAAHEMIIDRWRSHTGATGWVHFGNIGEWGDAYLDRAATTEYLQNGNNASTAAYYDAFTDGSGAPLDASVYPAYRVTFPADRIPQAGRFWSLTSYIPPGITLFPNPASKYVVASYTPGLQTNPDGSLTIFIQAQPPTTAPTANWLPVPSGRFSIILRVYGPEGNTAGQSYLPPVVTPAPPA